MLNIITYNIQYGKKLDSIIAWFNKLDKLPDIFCFQEFPEKYINKFINSLREKKYRFLFTQSLNKKKNIYGQLTLYDAEKLKVEEDKLVNLERSFLKQIFLPNHINRKALIVKFKYGQNSFILVNIHLTAFHFNSFRRKQIMEIIKLLKDQPKKIPQIFLGDLNYSSLIRRKKLLKLMADYGFTNAYKLKTHRLFLIRHQLDYVFYKNCLVLNPEVIKNKYSDHFAVRFKTQIG